MLWLHLIITSIYFNTYLYCCRFIFCFYFFQANACLPVLRLWLPYVALTMLLTLTAAFWLSIHAGHQSSLAPIEKEHFFFNQFLLTIRNILNLLSLSFLTFLGSLIRLLFWKEFYLANPWELNKPWIYSWEQLSVTPLGSMWEQLLKQERQTSFQLDLDFLVETVFGIVRKWRSHYSFIIYPLS